MSKGQGSCNAVNDQLSRLGQRLRGLSARKKANRSLSSLRKALGSCSSYLCNSQSNSLSQCLGNKKGGLAAGMGGQLNQRNARDPLVDNGQTSQLQGTKGSGPSNASVETADDGSGVSSRGAADTERTFRRQVESFVEREDVPEDVKDGVKNYFESIHQTQ